MDNLAILPNRRAKRCTARSGKSLTTLFHGGTPSPAAADTAVRSSRGRGAPRKPNILVIVGDDMGYADVGFHGCKDIPTPHLDALAAAGVRFTNGYVSGPYCSPTRAGLLTGRYQTRFGHEFNPGGGKQGLPLTETTIADRLQGGRLRHRPGRQVAPGRRPEMHPQQRGFDEFFGFLGGAHDYFQAGRQSCAARSRSKRRST